MANPQDARIDSILAMLTAEKSMFATKTITQDGFTLPIIATAPPHLPAYFETACALHKDSCVLVDGDERFSFGETYDQARALAGALIVGHGIEKGDRIGIAGRNSACWVISYMAVLMAGGVATLINGFWQGDEMAQAVADTGVKLLLVDVPRAQRIAQSGIAHSAKVIVVDDTKPVEDAFAPLMAAGGGAQTALPELTGDDPATILFTSGSTGKSKGAYSTHRQKVQGTYNYLVQTFSLLTYLTQDDRAPKNPPATLINVPLFHITGEVTVMLQGFALGRKMVVLPKWDAREAMELIQQERVTYFTGVPLMSFEILTHPDREKYDLSSCLAFAAGGAARPAQHVKRFHDEMKTGEPLVGYGLTETNAVGASGFGETYLMKPNSTGRPSLPLVDLAILDEVGQAVPQGERGEICIRSIANFSGYWNNEAATKEAFTADGYFRTGDIGYVDAENYLFIVDRKKDIIIRGGENITSLEVEAALYGCPEVAEASVIGLPDERFGEIPAAVVSLQPGKETSADALRAQVAVHLAAFKVPAKIWISSTQLPRLGTGKIDKNALRADYRARYAKGID